MLGYVNNAYCIDKVIEDNNNMILKNNFIKLYISSQFNFSRISRLEFTYFSFNLTPFYLIVIKIRWLIKNKSKKKDKFFWMSVVPFEMVYNSLLLETIYII